MLRLLPRNAHAHLSRFSSISGAEFVGFLDDAIESIVEPTENVNARNTGTTTMTNDTSFVSFTGATSSLSASQSKAFVAYCSSNTELQGAFVSQPPQPLFVRPLVMVLHADSNEIEQKHGQSMEHPLDPCQGRSERLLVSLQELQVTFSDPLRGQSAMPPVSLSQGGRLTVMVRQWRSLLQALFVLDQEHDERVWATLDEGCNAASHSASWAARAERYYDMFGHQLEYRENTRSKVFTGLGGSAVATDGRRKFPFALAFTSERDDILHLSGTIESWELPGDGPFLFSINAQARLGVIKDVAKSRIFIDNKPGFYLRMYDDAKTGLMLINMADLDLLNDQALTPQLLRASKPTYALPATIPTAGGEPANTLSSLAPMPLNPTLNFTRVAIGLTSWTSIPSPMAISPLHQ